MRPAEWSMVQGIQNKTNDRAILHEQAFPAQEKFFFLQKTRSCG